MYDLLSNEWMNIEACDGEPYSKVVILVGESLSYLTNDDLLPTLHRVVRSLHLPFPLHSKGQLQNEDRFSVPFFLSVKPGTEMRPQMSSEEKLREFDAVENFLWKQTKIANNAPSSVESILSRKQKGELRRATWRKSSGRLN